MLTNPCPNSRRSTPPCTWCKLVSKTTSSLFTTRNLQQKCCWATCQRLYLQSVIFSRWVTSSEKKNSEVMLTVFLNFSKLAQSPDQKTARLQQTVNRNISNEINTFTISKWVSEWVRTVQGLAEFGATQVLVVNMPPLGCFPALLTLYPNSIDNYDSYGCLTNLNKVSIAHNGALEEEVMLLRAKYPNVTYYLADFYSVYTDILAAPQVYSKIRLSYSTDSIASNFIFKNNRMPFLDLKQSARDDVFADITETLKACCGAGGSYNFNKEVTCSEIGKIGNQAVNLTAATCSNTQAFLNWDGIHPSDAANRVAALDFFAGKHITPSDFGCVVNTTQFWKVVSAFGFRHGDVNL